MAKFLAVDQTLLPFNQKLTRSLLARKIFAFRQNIKRRYHEKYRKAVEDLTSWLDSRVSELNLEIKAALELNKKLIISRAKQIAFKAIEKCLPGLGQQLSEIIKAKLQSILDEISQNNLRQIESIDFQGSGFTIKSGDGELQIEYCLYRELKEAIKRMQLDLDDAGIREVVDEI